MSADVEREFVDTNVLVYAHDASAGAKHLRAKQLLTELWAGGNGCLSVQVLQEFYVNITRKVNQPLDVESARLRVEDLSYWLVHSPTAADVVEAIQLHQRAHLSFWDAMVLTSAQKLGCNVLWSEDLNEDQVMAGVRIRNPFSATTLVEPTPKADH
jgi:predicted nucleic acid-binding protein